MHELNQITKAINKQRPAVVVTNFNPLRPEAHEVTDFVGFRTIRELAPATPLPFVCVLNGEPILRKDWDRLIQTGDVVVFQVLPQGGGGGGKNPLRTLLTIALIVATAYFAPMLGASLAGTLGVSAAVGTALATAGIYAIGSLAINAIAPIALPNSGVGGGSFDAVSPSPTYNISVQGNAARIEQPIPVVYGRHIVFPDFAAQPYYEYVGNEQFYYALLCIGQGKFSIENIKIDDTPLSNFDDVQYEIIEPGEKTTLVETNVVTSPEVSGQDMITNQYVGGFPVVAAGFTVNKIGVDILFPKGLYYANDDGTLAAKSASWIVEARQIDDADNALTAWTLIDSKSFTAASSTPQRLTYTYLMSPSGRYQVRVKRTDTRDERSRVAHDVSWGGLRGYLPVAEILSTTATFIALKIRASEQLSGLSSRKINAIVQRLIPKYVSGSWTTPQPTRSIIWAFCDVLRNTVYGGKIPDNRIDIDTLAALDAVFTARGDYFDGIFDSKITVWEALYQIARAGRSVPLLRGGVFTMIRDGQQTLPTAMFTMRNIAKNSLSIQYQTVTEDSPDAIEIEYFDETKFFPDYVTAIMPGVSSPENKAKIKLFGVTKRAQAEREAKFIVACAKYRRKIIKFSTEMEGFIPCYGDLIAISHDVPDWGVSGEVLDYNATTGEISLSEPVVLSNSGTSYVAFTRSNGEVHGAYAVQTPTSAVWNTVAGNWNTTTEKFDQIIASTIKLSGSLSYPLQTDLSRERTKFAFGGSEKYYQLARIIAIQPRTSEQVEITAIAEDNRVHQADGALV